VGEKMSGRTIGSMIDRVIFEASNKDDVALNEKEKQVHLSAKTSDSGESSSGSSKPRDDDKEQINKEKENDDNEAMKTAPDVDQIIEKLNSIRSGKSLHDSAVKSRFEGYVNDLKDTEKVALFAFLKGIAEIITGSLEPEQAVEPEDAPAKIHMHKKKNNGDREHNGKKLQKVSPKTNVVKKQASSGGKQKSGAEDSSVPIRVKR
jgi:hypothetical protein